MPGCYLVCSMCGLNNSRITTFWHFIGNGEAGQSHSYSYAPRQDIDYIFYIRHSTRELDVWVSLQMEWDGTRIKREVVVVLFSLLN